jgi:hypothetical protein
VIIPGLLQIHLLKTSNNKLAVPASFFKNKKRALTSCYEMLHGNIEIETVKEQGTIVRLLIPYPFKIANTRYQKKGK